MLDLVQLRSFSQVAERGTVAAAATALGYTAPAVSQHLTKLEAEIGATLFDRTGGRLHLTEAGEALRPLALEMADLDDRARAAVARPALHPHFVVAGFASALGAVVVPRLASLRSQMSVELHEAEDAEAMRSLSLGSVDLVLTQHYAGDVRNDDPRFTEVALWSDELRLVVPAGMAGSTTLDDVAGRPWLLNGAGTRCTRAVQRILADRGFDPVISATVSDNATLLDLVAAGHGVTIVPSRLLAAGHPGVVVADEELGVERSILGVVRTAIRPAVEPLLAALAAP